VIFVCYAAIRSSKDENGDGKDKNDRTIAYTCFGHSRSIYARTLRYIMIACLSLLSATDLITAYFRDTTTVIDLPLALVSLYLYRLFVVVELVGSVLDFPFFLAAPLIKRQAVRRIVWVVLFTFECAVYRVVGWLFLGGRPAWLVEEVRWKGETAAEWWSS
jgi:hypothetical protein